MEIGEEDKDKMDFKSHHGWFAFILIPFGLKHSPRTFQRDIDVILSQVKWQYALVYLDDVVVFSESLEQQFDRSSTVGRLFNNSGV